MRPGCWPAARCPCSGINRGRLGFPHRRQPEFHAGGRRYRPCRTLHRGSPRRCWRPGWNGAMRHRSARSALNDVVLNKWETGPHPGLRDHHQRALRELPRRRRHRHRDGDRIDRLCALLRRTDRGAGSRRLGARAHLPAHPERPADRGARRQHHPAAHVGPPRSARPGDLRRHRYRRPRAGRRAVRRERRRAGHAAAPAGIRLLPAAALEAALGPRRLDSEQRD